MSNYPTNEQSRAARMLVKMHGYSTELSDCNESATPCRQFIMGGEDSPRWVYCYECKKEGPKTYSDPQAAALWNLGARHGPFDLRRAWRNAKALVVRRRWATEYATCMCLPENKTIHTQMTHSPRLNAFYVMCRHCYTRSYFAKSKALAAALWTVGARVKAGGKRYG